MIPSLRRPLSAALTAAALLLPACAAAQSASGLPLPRFVSLRSEEVNLRTGPGDRYPVEWVYRRRDLPVEVVAEFNHWRKIRDWQGTEGWVHQSLLSGRRMMMVTGGRARPLRSQPAEEAAPIALLEPGVVGRLSGCPRNTHFCRAEAGGHEGWLKRDEFWGVYPGEWLD
jgi:SH3-like domain-containing protein